MDPGPSERMRKELEERGGADLAVLCACRTVVRSESRARSAAISGCNYEQEFILRLGRINKKTQTAVSKKQVPLPPVSHVLFFIEDKE